jgi:hypothetical protein
MIQREMSIFRIGLDEMVMRFSFKGMEIEI